MIDTRLNSDYNLYQQELAEMNEREFYEFWKKNRSSIASQFIFLNPLLRNKISDFLQGEILIGNSVLSKTLYEKGMEFLTTLGESVLHKICINTAQLNPEISIHILSTPALSKKICGIMQKDIIKENPVIAETLYRQNKHNLSNLRQATLYKICSKTAKNHPEYSIEMLSSAALRKKIDPFWQQLIVSKSPEIAKGLYAKGKHFLAQLDDFVIALLCSKTAKTNPEISIAIFSTPVLLVKISDFMQGLILAKNIKISMGLLPQVKYCLNLLRKFSPSGLEHLCEDTAKFDPELSIEILSTPELQGKLSDISQARIIEKNPDIAMALYKKGKACLDNLKQYALLELCRATAKDNPAISIDILSTKHLADKLNPFWKKEILQLNPEISQTLSEENVEKRSVFTI